MTNQMFYGALMVMGSVLAGCAADVEGENLGDTEHALNSGPECDPQTLDKEEHKACLDGRRLFDSEEFGGNGRTCLTCHSKETGTFNPEEVQARLASDPDDPLFVHDGLDDGFSGTSRIAEHATVRIEIPLPPHITLADDPTATSVVFNRGVPTTLNTPALDDTLMYDGRAPDLPSQALGAIHGHAQSTIEPTQGELDLIASFQQTAPRFFSSQALRDFAAGGPPPTLPDGETPAEKRGRAMFNDAPINPLTKEGICAMCHSGPMLNTTNNHNPVAPPGARFGGVQVSERNLLGNPTYTFLVDEGFGIITEVTTPDPGVLLTDPLPSEFPPFLPKSFPANMFKTPVLWGITKTAPYFHDNSAKTLEDVAEQYDFFFQTEFGFALSPQDQADMVAFMKLL